MNTDKRDLIKEYNSKIKGSGVFLREKGKFPPEDRKIIQEVGGEKVEKLTLFRYPIQLSKFAKFIGALERTPYDDLIHIGVVVNGKYLTEKDAVLNFEKAGVPSKATDVLDVPLGNRSITINDLLENTRQRMGDERFSTYKALSWNCQDYLQSMLEANGLSTAETTKFIKQDLEQIVKNLPSYADAISNFLTGAKAVVNRLTKGEGQCGGADDKQRGEAAYLRDYTSSDRIFRPSGTFDSSGKSTGKVTLKQELQAIVHSADPYSGNKRDKFGNLYPGQTYETNFFKDYTNTYDPAAQLVIDYARTNYLSELQKEANKPENKNPPSWWLPIGDPKRLTKASYGFVKKGAPVRTVSGPSLSVPAGTSSLAGPAIGGSTSIFTPTVKSKSFSVAAKGFTPKT